MRQTIPLGRIDGIRVGLNGSALIIVLLLAAGLAFGRLPAAHPGQSPAVYLAVGLLAAVLFLASILAHELAHALVARANGVGVDAITLWLLGGVAELRDEPRTPRAEFAIAVVGPLTSVLAGAVFGAVGYAASQGKRDFTSTSQIVAGRYDVLCAPPVAEQARAELAKLSLRG